MLFRLFFLTILLAMPVAATCQAGLSVCGEDSPLKYEVSTIHPSPSTRSGWMMNFTSSGFTARGVSAKQLLIEAFCLTDQTQLSNYPKWADSERFDVDAKISADDYTVYQKFTDQQKCKLLADLLRKRFGLIAHYATSESPGFELVEVHTKGKENIESFRTTKKEDDDGGIVRKARAGQLEVEDISLDAFARLLQGILGEPIENHLGLSGTYNLKLLWNANELNGEGADSSGEASIYQALQDQLGVQLKRAKIKVRHLVVDAIDHPDPN